MPELVKSIMKLFADDSKIYNSIKDANDAAQVQEDIDKLLNWSIEWQLPLNVGKCKVIHYGKKNPEHSYHMGNAPLSVDDTEKDVGVTFDSSLMFRQHIKQMIAKANSRVGMIKRSFSRLNKQGFKLLYKSLVRPILEYCSCIWNPIYKSDQLDIEKVQRRATKICSGLKDKSYPERLIELNLTTLAYRRQRADIIQVFRIMKQFDKIPFEQFFTFNESNTRGNGRKLIKPRGDTVLRQHTFSNRVINLWNDMPKEAVDCETINAFKNALERAWRNDPIKYNLD